MTTTIAEALAPEKWVQKNAGPLYAQLSHFIENAIRAGRFEEGDPLPSERDLAQITSLSRVTVRKAVQELVRDGFVVQKQGSGTSVASRLDKVQQSLSRLTSFSEDMERRGMRARSEWLLRGVFTPSSEETMALGLSSQINVARLERLRIADERPLAIERAAISAKIIPEPQEVGASLYSYLDELGMKPARAMQRISAHILSNEDAALLKVAKASAGLRIERISYLESGQIVEFTRSVYRGDAYDFVAELQISTKV